MKKNLLPIISNWWLSVLDSLFPTGTVVQYEDLTNVKYEDLTDVTHE